jgi:hypothetical protein
VRALQSFDGPDLRGGDGPMARAGLDLALLYQEFSDYVARGRPGAFATSLVGVRLDADRVLVDAIADDDDETLLLPQLQALGLGAGAARGRLASGWLPMAALDAASRLPGLRSLRPVYAFTNAGVVTSQGDTALHAAAARSTYGVDGAGTVVGVMSDSFNCKGGYASDVGTGDLPPGVTVLQEGVGCGSLKDEGRAMAQIVHDVAPGAGLAFHSAFNGTASFAQGILQLASTAGARVIVDDVAIFTEPMFQDGPIAQAVDSVVALGTSYLSAAGNQARQSYESDFRLSGTMGARGLRHNFKTSGNPDTLQTIGVPAGGQVVISLQWDQPFFSVSGQPGAASDLELVVYDAGQNPPALFWSAVDNVGGDAVDVLGFQNGGGGTATVQLAIELHSGPAPSHVKYVYYGPLTLGEFATLSGTVVGHPNAAGARAVGAADYHNTPAFGTQPPLLQSYSSRGGTTVLFNTAGAPVVQPRLKPEIAAADGVDTTFFYTTDTDGTGFPNFFGTSAAAPHVAAIAALLRDQNPAATPADIYSALLESAIDIATAGYDNDSGAGLVQADRALAYVEANAAAGALIGFATTPAGTALATPFAGDLFAEAGLKITDNDPATPSTSATALPGAGPTAGFLGPFLLAPGGSGQTWIDLELLPQGRDISFDFATPNGQIQLVGSDTNGTVVWSGTATGGASFASPGGAIWLAGSFALPSNVVLRKLRIQPVSAAAPLAIDNVRFTTVAPAVNAEAPIPPAAFFAAALAMAAAGARRPRRTRAGSAR